MSLQPATAPTRSAATARSRLEILYLSRATLVSLFVTGVEIWSLPSVELWMEKWVAFASVQVIATIVSFLLNKYWAFDASRRGRIQTQGIKNLLVFAGSWVLNTGISSLLAYRMGVSTRLAFTLSNVVVYLSWNYPLNRFWVFSGSPSSLEPTPDARG
jgi:putative flippase GtrA